MANKKFSAFSAESDINNFEGLVGFNTTGSLNQKIAPLEMPARVSDVTPGNTALGNAATLGGTSIGTAGEKNVAIGINVLANINTTGSTDPLKDCIGIGVGALKRIENPGSLNTGELIAMEISHKELTDLT